MGRTFALAAAIAAACSRPAPTPGPTEPVAPTPGRAAPTPTAAPVDAAPPAPPLATLPGDDKLDPKWRARFRTWLAAEGAGSHAEVIDVQEVSNGASIVLRRRVEEDGECREGPTTLSIIEDEGAVEPTFEVAHFGEDCCPGTTCTPTVHSWNLRYLAAVAAHDWKALATLTPTKGSLVWHASWSGEGGKGGEKTRKLARKDVAAGKLADAPGCGFINTTPSCELPDGDGTRFTCRCDGGGYHVAYQWQKEGAGFVLVRIDEESH